MPTKRLFMGISYMIFRKLLVCSKKQDPKSRLFSIWGPDIITQKLNTIKLLLFTLLEVSAKIITNSRHHIIKNSRSHHIVILSKSKKNLEVISNVYNRTRNNLCLLFTTICRDAIKNLTSNIQ